MKKWLTADIIALVVITLPIFFFFFRLLFPQPQLIITPDFGQSDAVTSFSTKLFLSDELKQGRIPLWTSLLGGGYPIHAHGSMGTFFLPNLLFFWLLSPMYAYIVVLFLSVSFMGWGMYVWLRKLGYQRLSSIFGSIIVALSGYVIAQFTHITIIESLSIFPLLCACVHDLAQKKSWSLACLVSLLLSQQILVGFPQSVFITILFILAYYGYLIRGSGTKLFDAFRLCMSFVGAGAIAAVQLIPSLEYLSMLDASKGFSPDAATIFSFPYKHLLTLVHPFLLGNPAIGTYPHFLTFSGSIFWENTIYIGVAPLLCFLIWIIIRKKISQKSKHTPFLLFFVFILIASLLLASGRNSPLYFIFSLWPFSIFRVPSRFIWIFTIACAVITTHAYDMLLGVLRQKRLAALVGIFILVLQILTVFTLWSPYHNTEPAKAWLETPTLVQYMDSDSFTLTIGGERLYNNTYKNGWVFENPDNRPSYILRNTLTPDKNMLWQIPQIRDYAGRNIRRSKILSDLLDQSISSDATQATISAFGNKLLTILSVGNVISTLPLENPQLVSRAQLTDPSHVITLYTNNEALPKAYVATSGMPAKTVEEAVDLFTSDAFVPGTSVLTEDGEAFSAETATPGVVQIHEKREGYYKLTATNPQKKAILVITESYYPGWHVKIDGKEANVFPVNVKHIGAYIPSGDHTVVVYFQPKSFTQGAWVSVVSLIATVLLMVFFRRLES